MGVNKIGNYVHLGFENYLKYSLNTLESGKQETVDESYINQIFKNQTDSIMERARLSEQYRGIDINKIETELNYYFDARKGNLPDQLNSKITQEDLNNMRKAIEEFLGEKLQKIKIDENTLSSTIVSGKFNMAILADEKKYGQDLTQKLKSYGTSEIGTSGRVSKKAIERRIKLLLEIRDRLKKADKMGSAEIIVEINALNAIWGQLKSYKSFKEANDILTIKESSKLSHFVDDLNIFLSSAATGSSTLHGEYAEAIVVATNFLVNAQAKVGTAEILAQLGKGVKGQERSAKGLKADFFDENLIDLQQVTAGSIYSYTKNKDSEGNIFSSKITQDKVDVEIEVSELEVPASIKNYNFGNNYFSDIHLLQGRSVLVLLQDSDSDFVNHFLNIAAEHDDIDVRSSNYFKWLDKANEVVKLTILLKALAGSVFGRDANGNTGFSQKAELFIINDNSAGRFRVYLIDDIIGRVIKRIELLKTGDFDKAVLNNTYVGSMDNPNMGDARVRISNLLAQLNSMQLKVSIDKSVLMEE